MQPTPRTAISPTLMAVLAGLAGLAGCTADLPTGAEAIRDYSGVGDCLRPDPARLDGFVQAACGDDLASVEIIEMVANPGIGTPVCPPGTDQIVDGEQGPVADGEIAGVPEVWCLRNLEPPHPGDPGEGGGELVPDDCFGVDRLGAVIETGCDGRDVRYGGQVPERRLVAIEDAAGACPTDADAIELEGSPPQVLCAADLLDGSP